MDQFDVISVGDALIDEFISIHESSEHLSLEQSGTLLCAPYGRKVPVEDCQFLLGGNACNFAVGVSRLGFSSALCAEIGDDEFAQKIITGIKRERVNDKLVLLGINKPSSFAIGINFRGERTLFVDHVVREHNFSFNNVSSKVVYLTSIGDRWEEAYERAIQFCQESKALLAFSPGTHQLMKGPYYVMKIVTKTNMLFVNKDEAMKILTAPPVEIKELLILLQKAGPKIVSITDGNNGSYAIAEDGKCYHIGIASGDPVERTGAGDAYASGFLASYLSGNSIPEAMRWGSINAASVIGSVGAQPGLLNLERMKRHLDVLHAFQATEV